MPLPLTSFGMTRLGVTRARARVGLG